MYPIETAVAELFKLNYRQVVEITVYGKDSTFTLTEADFVQKSLTIDRYCVSGNKIEIGSAIAAELTLTLSNLDGRFDNTVFEGAELFVRIGIKKWDADKWEKAQMHYIPMGYFTVDTPPRKLSQISLSALDRMMRFDRDVDWEALTFPITVENLLQHCCDKCNVAIHTEIANLPNAKYSIPSAPSSTDITYRQLVQWISEITGTCAFIDWNGYLRMEWYKDTATTITAAERYDSDMYENDITITGVQITDLDKNTYLSGSEGYMFNIEGNELIQSDYQIIADNIGANVVGLSYRVYTCTTKPMPHVYPLDKITYVDKKGVSHNTIVTGTVFTINLGTEIVAKGETSTTNSYAATSPLTARERAILEKMKNDTSRELTSRQQAVLELNQVISNSLGLYRTEVENDNGSVTYYYHNGTTLAGSSIIYTFREGGFAWTDDWNNGSPVWQYGITAEGNAVLNYLSVYKLTADHINVADIVGAINESTGETELKISADHITFQGDTLTVLLNEVVTEDGLTNTLGAYVTADQLTLKLSEYTTAESLANTLQFYVTATELGVELSSYVTSGSLSDTLESYVTAEALATTLTSYATTGEVESKLSLYVTSEGLATQLSSYVTNTGLSNTLQSYVTSSALGTTLQSYVTAKTFDETLDDYVTSNALENELSIYVTSSSLSTTLSSYVTNGALTNRLSSYVTSTALSTTLASYDTSEEINSKLSLYATSSELTSEISRAEAVEKELSSRITQTANAVSVVVDGENIKAAEIIAAINNTTSSVTISADKINLNGAITANGTFKISTAGTITATGGTIGGFTITNSGLYSGNLNQFYENPIDIWAEGKSGVFIGQSGINLRSTVDGELCQFWVNNDGQLYIQQGNVGGAFLSFDFDGLTVYNGYAVTESEHRSVRIQPGGLTAYINNSSRPIITLDYNDDEAILGAGWKWLRGSYEVAAPYVTTGSVDVYSAENTSLPADSGYNATIRFIKLGGMGILSAYYASAVEEDHWYRLNLSTYFSTIYGAVACGRSNAQRNLAGTTSGGVFTVYITGTYVYVGCDNNSNGTGFYLIVVGQSAI